MGNWLNGGDEGGRTQPKTVAVPVSKEEISRAIVKSATIEREAKQRSFFSGVVSNILHLIQDYGFHSGYGHRRYRPRVSTRAQEIVIGEVRRFYAQRPRPWCSPNARARLLRNARRRLRSYPRHDSKHSR